MRAAFFTLINPKIKDTEYFSGIFTHIDAIRHHMPFKQFDTFLLA
tara:strand:- start:132701 stop:132835 length:135 start_codon:yes stop_codon:yes gene_type:complete